jgi:hypothetical protein
VWESTVDGRTLTFHLAGINNQNFIMRDDETGSWWQQITGEAIHGPLKGRKLNVVDHDEVAFELWKQANPNGRVLQPDPGIASRDRYERPDWEERYSSLPVVTHPAPDSAFPPRTLVVGVKINGQSRAYPASTLEKQRILIDFIGSTPVLIVTAGDGKSIRGYERTVDGQTLEFFVRTDGQTDGKGQSHGKPVRMVDDKTASEWDFWGRCTSGPLSGKSLKKIYVLKDYWFDWKAYNPDTSVYSSGD